MAPSDEEAQAGPGAGRRDYAVSLSQRLSGLPRGGSVPGLDLSWEGDVLWLRNAEPPAFLLLLGELEDLGVAVAAVRSWASDPGVGGQQGPG